MLRRLEVDVAVADLYGVDLDGVGGVRDALAGGQVVDLLVEGGGDGGVAVLLADDAACEDQCLAVRVEVVAGEDAVLGLVDRVLVAVDSGLHPSFLRGQIRRRCVPSSQPWGFPFEVVVCAARGAGHNSGSCVLCLEFTL